MGASMKRWVSPQHTSRTKTNTATTSSSIGTKFSFPPAGDALFLRLRDTATAFDRRLRAGLSEGEVSQLEALLTRLCDNVSGG